MPDLRIPNSDRPNLPDVAGTTLALLATVLAGFAVTIIAGLVTRDDVRLTAKAPNTGLIVALILLAIAVPVLLVSASFAVWAQQFNFLHLEEAKKVLPIKEEWQTYIPPLIKRWRLWHRATIGALYIGAYSFQVAVGLILWAFIGPLAGCLFYGAALACIVAGIAVSCFDDTSALNRWWAAHRSGKNDTRD